eukprot:TRINITY_DN21849_c0_g2_i1.p1 TRINITY_DN21849_c0_g2~~TRINITY_DN21849_c0_g2_i1.p1  ORF type:complete len:2261 (-),score=305.86 TRINITY_DN21849_c0_g2_i1:45-6827(-)
MRQQSVDDGSTYRLKYTTREGQWHLFSCIVDNPRPGVLLRWTTRANFKSFLSYNFKCVAVSGATKHKFTFNVLKQHVTPSAMNPTQREYLISVQPPPDEHTEPSHDCLRFQHSYKFQVIGVGAGRVELETSCWSALNLIEPPAALTDIPFILMRVFCGLPEEKLSSLQVFCHQDVSQKDMTIKVMLYDLVIHVHHSLLSTIETEANSGQDVLLTLGWEGAASPEHKLKWDFASPHSYPFRPLDSAVDANARSHTGLYMRNVDPISLEATKTSMDQKKLMLQLGTAQGEVFLSAPLNFNSLLEQWELQHDLFGSEESVDSNGYCWCQPERDGERRPTQLQARPKAENANAQMEINLEGAAVMFWVAFGDNDPFPKGNIRWTPYPLTPYASPSTTSLGTRRSANEAWARCSIRGLMPSELVLQGTKKELFWDAGLRIGNEQVREIRLELRPVDDGRWSAAGRRSFVIAERIPVSKGHYVWNVPIDEDGQKQMDGRFVVVATKPGGSSSSSNAVYTTASVEFFIDRPLMISEFEVGYAAFCRSFRLPMESLTQERLESVGLKVSEVPMCICQDLRPVLPIECVTYNSDQLRACAYDGAMIPSTKPIQLEGQAEVYRSALRMVKVLEGASWSPMVARRGWRYDVLLDYNIDYSWDILKRLVAKGWSWRMAHRARRMVHSLQEIALYMCQILVFSLPAATAFLVLVAHQYMKWKVNPDSELSASTKYITDWCFNPGHVQYLLDQSIEMKIMLAVLFSYSVFVITLLFYMDFFRTYFPGMYMTMNGLAYLWLGSAGFVLAIFMSITLMWVLLGALINPQKLLPVAVMTGSLFVVGRTLFRHLLAQKEHVLQRIDAMTNFILEAVLDEFIDARPELKSATKKNLKIEDFDAGKGLFVRALCDLGKPIRKNKGHTDRAHGLFSLPGASQASAPTAKEDEDDDDGDDVVDEAAEGQFGRFDISPVVRNKLQACFGYIIVKEPLPPGVQQSLRDPKTLARLCMEKRQAYMQRLTGPQGKKIVQDIVDTNLETRLDDAMVTVLSPFEGSDINVLNAEALTKDCVLFFDQQLNDQIQSMVACVIDEYRLRLMDDIKDLFDMFTTKSRTSLTSTDLYGQLMLHETEFNTFVKKSGLRFELAHIDASSDGTANCGLIPFLQAVEVLPPLRVMLAKAGENHLKQQIEGLMQEVKRHTNGHLVLRNHDVNVLLSRLTDLVGDGRVDHLWWGAFKTICLNLYVYHPDGIDSSGQRYPCTISDLEEVWGLETLNMSLLLQAQRIDDVVLAGLMTKQGRKKIWREAFILLARHLHVWPEIPIDDAVVEIVADGADKSAVVLSNVPCKVMPELDKFGRVTKPLQDLSPSVRKTRGLGDGPPRLGQPVFQDDDYAIESFGDFSPESGFAMLHFSRKALQHPSDEKWLTIDWDRDAKQSEGGVDTSNEPPFPGPLKVYMVFYNLHPTKKHRNHLWIKRQEWQKQKGMVAPTVASLDELERRSAVSGTSRVSLGDVFASMPDYGGFPAPDWIEGEDGEGKTPEIEILMKEFDSFGQFGAADSAITLMGLNSKEPVLIFFQTQRTSIPEPNSFKDAHEAPFLRSDFFKKHWRYFDIAEQLFAAEGLAVRPATRKSTLASARRATGGVACSSKGPAAVAEDEEVLVRKESVAVLNALVDLDVSDCDFDMSVEESGAIDVSPDGPDLIGALFTKHYVVNSMEGMLSEPKNEALRIITPERLRLGYTVEQRHTERRRPVWLRGVCQGFFVEDLDFVELDTLQHKHYLFKALDVRDRKIVPEDGPVPTKVKHLALLHKGVVVWDSANPTEVASMRDDPSGGIAISFKEPTQIDQLDFVTYGQPLDPCKWKILSGDGDPVVWDNEHPVSVRELSYPLDNGEELVQVGRKQDGQIWHRIGDTWLQTRGVWFDAFVELLTALGLQMDRNAAWSLWRTMLSFKYEPIAAQSPPGFISIADAKAALMSIMATQPFLSDQTFSNFNSESRLELQDVFAKRMYKKICSKTPDYRGAPNLVSWKDFSKYLRRHIENSKPHIDRKEVSGDGHADVHYVVGGMWMEPLYQVIVSSMPEVPKREEIRAHFDTYADRKTGLLPVDRTYDLIAKLGRPGLKFEQFVGFVRRLGFNANDKALDLTFNQIDIDQSHTLDALEAECGLNLLMRSVLPKQVLMLAGLQTEQIIIQVMATLMVLVIVFLFLALSFASLLEGHVGGVYSLIQSVVAGGAALAANFEGGAVGGSRVEEYILRLLERCIGAAARHAASQAERQGRGGVS